MLGGHVPELRDLARDLGQFPRPLVVRVAPKPSQFFGECAFSLRAHPLDLALQRSLRSCLRDLTRLLCGRFSQPIGLAVGVGLLPSQSLIRIGADLRQLIGQPVVALRLDPLELFHERVFGQVVRGVC